MSDDMCGDKDIIEIQYQCWVCGKVFPNLFEMKKHFEKEANTGEGHGVLFIVRQYMNGTLAQEAPQMMPQ